MAEYEIPDIGEVPDNFFDAAGKLTSGELAGHLNKIGNATKLWHEPVVSSSSVAKAPGLGSQEVAIGGALLGLAYDTPTDVSYKVFKIPNTYVGDASFHIHWTKSADVSEAGNVVRWKLSYVVFDGTSQEVADGVSPTVLTVDDAYVDASSNSSRVVYSTSWVEASGFQASHYVGLKVEYVAANTTLVNYPVLVAADLVLRVNINK